MSIPLDLAKFQIVTPQGLERELELVRATTRHPRHGAFGPRSEIWRINREAALFLGAGRAMLLQLAHPWVAAAITQNSRTLVDPIGRFHRTFGIVFNMVFGDLDHSLAAARRLHRRHRAIRGTLQLAAGPYGAGSAYFANSLPALRWVWATLTDTSLVAHGLLFQPPTGQACDRYYADSQWFAALFGIPQSQLPPNWRSFRAYFEAMTRSNTLTVTAQARAIAHRLLDGTDLWFPVPRPYKALTAGLLPPALREGFGLRYGVAERQSARQLVQWMRRAYPLLPDRLRFVGPYHEAMARIAGQPAPDYLTQLSNRVWIGRPRLNVAARPRPSAARRRSAGR